MNILLVDTYQSPTIDLSILGPSAHLEFVERNRVVFPTMYNQFGSRPMTEDCGLTVLSPVFS